MKEKFDYTVLAILVFFLMIVLCAVAYLSMVGQCMERGKYGFGLKYEDTFGICAKQIGAFKK